MKGTEGREEDESRKVNGRRDPIEFVSFKSTEINDISVLEEEEEEEEAQDEVEVGRKSGGHFLEEMEMDEEEDEEEEDEDDEENFLFGTRELGFVNL